MKRIRVLIVDDSALVRQFLAESLAMDPMIEVMGTAIDPVFAFSKIMKDQPDVITLDVEMPRMDGLTFLEKLMNSYPIPVVMISSMTKKGGETTMRALELGAVDFITKPNKNLFENLNVLKSEIIRKVKSAANANLKMARPNPLKMGSLGAQERRLDQGTLAGPVVQGRCLVPNTGRPEILVIGASTGGVNAIKKVLSDIRPNAVPVLVVLHMPAAFTGSFARNLSSVLAYPIKEAETGEVAKPGHIYVAPGNKNTLVERAGQGLKFFVTRCDTNDIYKPSVDKAFFSLTKAVGNKAAAVLLTGMGDDGARGMLLLRQAGARTIAQDQESSLIYGMPRRAAEMGAAQYILHLDDIGAKITEWIGP